MENNTWKTYNLGEVTTKIGSGSTPTGGSNAYKEEGISLIRSQNILDFTFSKGGLAFIDDEQAFKLRGVNVEENDILFNITGDSVARVCKVPNEILPARVNQHVAILRADNINLNYDYLLYLLQSRKEELLIMSEIGATRNAITKVMLETLEIQLPPFHEQKAIAAVLSSLDDKIDLLQQQNQTLEALAETLFRQWFIEEAKEDWEEGKLEQLVLSANTGLDAIRRAPIVENNTGIKCLRIQDISQNKTYDNWGNTEVKDSDYVKAQLKRGDIIMARTCSPGILLHVQEDLNAVFNNGLARIRANENSHPIFLKYLFKTNEFTNHIYGISDGTAVQLNMKLGDLLSYDLKIPPKNFIDRFVEIVSEWNDKILANKQQIQTLTQLRDTLLPKLMSGEVRVKLKD